MPWLRSQTLRDAIIPTHFRCEYILLLRPKCCNCQHPGLVLRERFDVLLSSIFELWPRAVLAVSGMGGDKGVSGRTGDKGGEQVPVCLSTLRRPCDGAAIIER